jgi:hypothetical protein
MKARSKHAAAAAAACFGLPTSLSKSLSRASESSSLSWKAPINQGTTPIGLDSCLLRAPGL